MLLQSEDEIITNIEGGDPRNLIDAIIEVKPDIVQLEVPYRPPSESYVKQPPQERLRQISRDLSEALGEEKLWTYGIHDGRGRSVAWLKHESLEKEVLDLLRRRPCRPIDVSISLGIDLPTAEKILKSLEKRARANMRTIKDEKFYFERQ